MVLIELLGLVLRAVGAETAVPMGGVEAPVPAESSESSEASSSTTTGGGMGCELLCEEELLLELEDEEAGRVRLPPNCIGGIAGTGGMPAALSEALLLLEPPPALVGLFLEGDCLGDEDRPAACLYVEFDMFRAWPG